jgi:uncharacterized protein YqgC (DUF456 family)
LTLQTVVIIAVGLIGCIVPLLAGPPIVWMGRLSYAGNSQRKQVGWFSLAILLVLALVGSTANSWMSWLGARKGGASGWATVASIGGGLIGLVFFNLSGMILGSIAAIAAVEYYRHGDWNKVLKASSGYVVGYLLAMLVEIGVCLLMIGIFVAGIYL